MRRAGQLAILCGAILWGAVLCGAVVGSGCSNSRATTVGGDDGSAGPPRDATPVDATPVDAGRRDRGPIDAVVADGPPGHPPVDAGSADACYCPAGQVWRNNACLANDALGCGPSCDPSSPSACPSGETCNKWGAASCCICAQAEPACVPDAVAAPGTPITGPLRLGSTSGTAGQPVSLRIEGAPFYVGALFYVVRIGQQETMDVATMQPCVTQATFTPLEPGIYPVEVSQYGGGEPWVLAGFFTASGGVPPSPAIQPGFACSASGPACAEAPPYACGCDGGRCRCQRK